MIDLNEVNRRLADNEELAHSISNRIDRALDRLETRIWNLEQEVERLKSDVYANERAAADALRAAEDAKRGW